MSLLPSLVTFAVIPTKLVENKTVNSRELVQEMILECMDVSGWCSSTASGCAVLLPDAFTVLSKFRDGTHRLF